MEIQHKPTTDAMQAYADAHNAQSVFQTPSGKLISIRHITYYSEDLFDIRDFQYVKFYIPNTSRISGLNNTEFESTDDLPKVVDLCKKRGWQAFPVYLYEHGDISLDLYSKCPWDSSLVGFAWVGKRDLMKVNKSLKQQGLKPYTAEEYVASCLQDLEDEIRSEVYGIGYLDNQEDVNAFMNCDSEHCNEYYNINGSKLVEWLKMQE